MKTVNIGSALYYGKEISGNFPYVGSLPKDAACTRDLYLRIVRGDRTINVQVMNTDFKVSSEDGTFTHEAEVKEYMRQYDLIQERFEIMEQLTEMIVSCDIQSLIISGAPGVGKSHHLLNRLNGALDADEIGGLDVMKGRISPIVLFQRLYESREKGSVMLLDDIDDIFTEETSLNLLKAVLDTGERRTVSWLTASSWLEEQGIPNEFDFEGSIIFVTNLDFDRVIERGSAIGQHLKALLSRSNYLDLGIHANREIMMRIKQVVATSDIATRNGMNEIQIGEMLDWLEANCDNLRDLSLRSVLKIAGFMKGEGDWTRLATATMVKHTRF